MVLFIFYLFYGGSSHSLLLFCCFFVFLDFYFGVVLSLSKLRTILIFEVIFVSSGTLVRAHVHVPRRHIVFCVVLPPAGYRRIQVVPGTAEGGPVKLQTA